MEWPLADHRIAHALREASDTRAVVIEAGALAATEGVLAGCFGDDAAAVLVADETTFAPAGAAGDEALRGARREGLAPPRLPAGPPPHPRHHHPRAGAPQPPR